MRLCRITGGFDEGVVFMALKWVSICGLTVVYPFFSSGFILCPHATSDLMVLQET